MNAFPEVQAKIRGAVEAEGLNPEEVMRRLHEEAELQLLGDEAPDADHIPSHIYIIAQALAYRSAIPEDESELHGLLNEAYRDEIEGPESFRTGEAVSRDEVNFYLNSPNFNWILAEAPNGHGIEKDGILLGACCFSTDGVSRRNGLEEGRLGSLRYFAVRKAYQGLCVGRRLLEKAQDQIFREARCCRVMACVPDTRGLVMKWLGRRGFVLVRAAPYPFQALGHERNSQSAGREVQLNQYTLISPLL
eukprot:gene45764-56014_t